MLPEYCIIGSPTDPSRPSVGHVVREGRPGTRGCGLWSILRGTGLISCRWFLRRAAEPCAEARRVGFTLKDDCQFRLEDESRFAVVSVIKDVTATAPTDRGSPGTLGVVCQGKRASVLSLSEKERSGT